MSIKGPAIRWMEAAITRGDFAAAWSEAFEMKRVPLDHALALTILASDTDQPDRAERAAARWLARAAVEQPGVDLAALGSALDRLPDLVAVSELSEICTTCGWPLAGAALDHLLPA